MTELSELQKLLGEYTSLDEQDITPDKHLVSDLGLDSFTLLEAVMGFEEHFEISIPDKDLHLLDTVQDVIDYLDENMEE